MARRFADQVLVSRDASSPMELITKQQYDAAKDAVGGWPVLDSGSRIVNTRMPIVSSPIRSGSASSSLTSDASSGAGNYLDIAITGNATINAPTNAVNWQIFKWHLLASGAARTITFGGGIIAGGAGLGPYNVPRGSVLIAEAQYVGNRTNTSDVSSPAWALTSATITDAASALAAHASTHATAGSDPIAPSDIGALAVNNPVFTGSLSTLNGTWTHERTATTNSADAWQVTGDTTPRLGIWPDGFMRWSPGNAAGDVYLERLSAGVLHTNGSFKADKGILPGIVAMSNVAAAGTISIDASLGSLYRVTVASGACSLAVPSNPTDGESINVEITATAAATIAINASIINCTGVASPMSIAAGKCLYLGMRYRNSAWRLIAYAIEP